MIGKIKYESFEVTIVIEEFVKCMFERLGFIQLKDDDLQKKLNRIISFSLEGIIPKETNIEMNN